MLRIHRKQPDTGLLYGRHDQMPRCHQCFLIGKRNVLSCSDGRKRRTDPDHPHYGIDKKIRLRDHRCLQKAVHPGQNADRQIRHPLFQLQRRLLIK